MAYYLLKCFYDLEPDRRTELLKTEVYHMWMRIGGSKVCLSGYIVRKYGAKRCADILKWVLGVYKAGKERVAIHGLACRKLRCVSGRVEIRRKRAIIFLNPCICYEEMIQKIKAEFHLDHNEAIRDISVKADGSRHYRCDCEEDRNG